MNCATRRSPTNMQMKPEQIDVAIRIYAALCAHHIIVRRKSPDDDDDYNELGYPRMAKLPEDKNCVILGFPCGDVYTLEDLGNAEILDHVWTGSFKLDGHTFEIETAQAVPIPPPCEY